MRHGFIGFGNLAQAIYQGLKTDTENSFSYISKSNKYTQIPAEQSLTSLVNNSDVIWLCVKPQNIKEVLQDLQEISLEHKTIVSPIAGKSISYFQNFLGKDIEIIRIMPNLAIAYQHSVTAFVANRQSATTKKLQSSLEQLGKVVEIPEADFDAFTAVFGSGPAFLLQVLESFQTKTKDLGLSDTDSTELLAELLHGTTQYFQENGAEKSIAELIQNVASKGGVTQAGLDYYKENKGSEILENTLSSAEKRSAEMGE